jgi:hypothetical protein
LRSEYGPRDDSTPVDGGKSGDGSCLRRSDVVLHILVEQQAFLLEALGGKRDHVHIARMVLVALLEREARISCRQSLYPRLSERNPLTGRIAPIHNRYRVSRRLGAQGPAGKGCERHEDVRRVDAGDVVPVSIRLGNEDLIGRAEEKGRELPQDTVIEPQPEIPEIAGVMDAVVRNAGDLREPTPDCGSAGTKVLSLKRGTRLWGGSRPVLTQSSKSTRRARNT